ncbi:MAG: universal stress protein [Lewinellaceae bacterium]|nr:universal stress protein [Lewinellaceae bacterium]
MKTILVPTDFSKCANNAMMYALEVAQRTQAKIVALYVVYPNEGVDNNVYDAFWIDDYIKQRRQSMQTWAKRFAKSEHLRTVKIETECRVGFPAATIVHAAEDIKADMIVMGTTGASGLRGVLLGSVAANVLSGSKIPVLIVPKKASFRNHARFVFATDFRMHLNQHTLNILKTALNIQHTGLDVVHVFQKAGAEPKKAAEESLGKKLGSIPHAFHYLHNTNVAQAVSDFVESTNANGVVAVSHEHSLLHKLFSESVSRSLAHRTTVPLLVLHDAE